MGKLGVALSLCVALAAPAVAEEENSANAPQVRIVGIEDGRKFWLEDDSGHRLVCRLYGVELPRRKQRFGRQARVFLRNLAMGQTVNLERLGNEAMPEVIMVTDVGGSINQMLVATGAAWVTSDCKEEICGEWRDLMRNAKQKRAGLWREKNPEPPWKYRKSR